YPIYHDYKENKRCRLLLRSTPYFVLMIFVGRASSLPMILFMPWEMLLRIFIKFSQIFIAKTLTKVVAKALTKKPLSLLVMMCVTVAIAWRKYLLISCLSMVYKSFN